MYIVNNWMIALSNGFDPGYCVLSFTDFLYIPVFWVPWFSFTPNRWNGKLEQCKLFSESEFTLQFVCLCMY